MRSYHKRDYYDIQRACGIDDARGDAAKPNDAEWFEHEALLSGDYCGCGAIAISNRRVIEREYPTLEGSAYFTRIGSHGSAWMRLAIELDRDDCREEWRDLKSLIDGLDDYIIADEVDESEVEHDAEIEAWDSYGASDFASCLAKMAPHHDSAFFRVIAQADGYAGLSLWHKLAEAASVNGGSGVEHQSDGAHFCFDDFFGTRRHWQAKEWPWPRVRAVIVETLAEHRAWRREEKARASVAV